MPRLPDFTVVRATTYRRNTRTPVTAILVKVEGTWEPPGEETWWVDSDEELYIRFHSVEILASPPDAPAS